VAVGGECADRPLFEFGRCSTSGSVRRLAHLLHEIGGSRSRRRPVPRVFVGATSEARWSGRRFFAATRADAVSPVVTDCPKLLSALRRPSGPSPWRPHARTSRSSTPLREVATGHLRKRLRVSLSAAFPRAAAPARSGQRVAAAPSWTSSLCLLRSTLMALGQLRLWHGSPSGSSAEASARIELLSLNIRTGV
jgi:hypothetical protein